MSLKKYIVSSITSIVAILVLSISSLVSAGVDTFSDENDVSLAGYDTVAYFTKNKAVKGSSEITAIYNDVIYRFSSKKNRDLFKANPEKYAPQYGGFCAYGLTFGKKLEVDGKAFEIVDGKLYVNKDKGVYKAWKKDVNTHINQADEKWSDVEGIDASKL